MASTARLPATAKEKRAQFGCDLHPLAELRQQQLEGPSLTQSQHQDATRLAVPFKILDSDISPFRLEAARRIAAMNSAAGLPAKAPLPAADRDAGTARSPRSFLRAVGSLGFGPTSLRLQRADAWPR
jgi:hypothetical protein